LRKLLSKRLRLASIILLLVGFAGSAVPASGDFQSEQYWLEKSAWEDRPSYAEEINVQYSPTDLIQKRETREVCASYTNTTDGTITCEDYENETHAGSDIPVFNITSGRSKYLGNGYIRTNLEIEVNQLSTNILKESTFLMSESEYITWFNERYYYNGTNITGSELDNLQDKLSSISARGGNTNLLATRTNSFEIQSADPFEATANTTMVFRFEDFRSGSFVLSDLIRTEVNSGLKK